MNQKLNKFDGSIRHFPNWRNSVQTATWQMIGHALLSTNFNTPQSRQVGLVVEFWSHKLEVRVQIPAEVGELFNLKNLCCQLPIENKFRLEKTIRPEKKCGHRISILVALWDSCNVPLRSSEIIVKTFNSN